MSVTFQSVFGWQALQRSPALPPAFSTRGHLGTEWLLNIHTEEIMNVNVSRGRPAAVTSVMQGKQGCGTVN